MKLIILFITLCSGINSSMQAQVYFTKNGNISFFSSTMLEDIKADNNQVVSVINTTTKEMQFSLLNNAFHFKKALMEEHFNDDYIESAKFPKSVFKGTIDNINSTSFSTDGTYQVTVSGNLSIHGVTKPVTAAGTITVKSGKITAVAKFKLKPRDYNISIPSAVKENIAENIEVTVSCLYEKK